MFQPFKWFQPFKIVKRLFAPSFDGWNCFNGWNVWNLFRYAEQIMLMTAWRFSTITALSPRSRAGCTSAGSVTFSP